MKNVIVTIVVLLIVFSTGSQLLSLYKAKSDFGDGIERQLDFVDAASLNTVSQDVVKEGQKLGLKLTTDNVHITYDDTDIQSYAQQVVGGKLGAQYKNKRVVITVHYVAHVLGLPLNEELTKFKIRQVEAPQLPPTREAQQLLDSQ